MYANTTVHSLHFWGILLSGTWTTPMDALCKVDRARLQTRCHRTLVISLTLVAALIDQDARVSQLYCVCA